MRIAIVNFPNSTKNYNYYCPWPSAAVGDIVMTPTGKARIIDFMPSVLPDYKTLLGVYTPEGATLLNPTPNIDRAGEIINELRKIAKQHELFDQFAPLAKKDPKAKKLLAALKKLRS